MYFDLPPSWIFTSFEPDNESRLTAIFLADKLGAINTDFTVIYKRNEIGGIWCLVLDLNLLSNGFTERRAKDSTLTLVKNLPNIQLEHTEITIQHIPIAETKKLCTSVLVQYEDLDWDRTDKKIQHKYDFMFSNNEIKTNNTNQILFQRDIFGRITRIKREYTHQEYFEFLLTPPFVCNQQMGLKGGFFKSIPDDDSKKKELFKKYNLNSEYSDRDILEKAFRRAAAESNLEDIKFFIEKCKVDVNSQDSKQGRSALHWVVIRANEENCSQSSRAQYIECGKLLLENGAKPELTDSDAKSVIDYNIKNVVELRSRNINEFK